MVKLLRKDLITTYKNRNTLMLILISMPTVLILYPKSGIESGIERSFYVILHILMIIQFDMENKKDLKPLFHSLPVTSEEIVVSKYLMVIPNFIFAILILYSYLGLVSLLGANSLEGFNLYGLINTFFISVFLLSIYMPLYFRFNIRVISGVSGGSFVLVLNLLDIIKKSLFVGPYRTITPIVILIIYISSIYLSLSIYKKKDLV